MRRSAVLIPLFGALLPLACGGTETGNPASPAGPLTHFESSACKTDANAESGSNGQTQQALVVASSYDGLQCIEWEHGASAGDITLRLINFPGGCSVKWDGKATVDAPGTVDLELVNTGCTVARCGTCLYDATYDLTGITNAASLGVRIGYVDCPTMGDVRWQFETTLAMGTSPSGITCRYAPLNSVLSSKACGGPNLLCGGASGICNSTPCPGDLVCAPVSADDQRCLAACTTDGDCSPAGTLTCVAGLCRVAKPW
jgi:hypothetical protein